MSSTRKKPLLLFTCVVLGTALLTGMATLAYTEKRARGAKPRNQPFASPTPAPKPSPPNRKVDGLIVLTLSRFGFEPANTLERAMGHLMISVLNRSGVRNLNLRLDRVAGSRLRDVNMPIEKGKWEEEIDLAPGEYVLSEANHPNWICRITVTQKKP